MTKDRNRTSNRSFREGSVLIVYQKPEDLNLTNDSLQ